MNRVNWIGDKDDCTVTHVDDARYVIALPFYDSEIAGMGWADVSETTRGFFKRRVLSMLFACTQVLALGTNRDESGRPVLSSCMYRNETPKVSAYYEVLRTVDLEPCGYRVFFVVHDPAFHFAEGIIHQIFENTKSDRRDGGQGHRRREELQPRQPGTEYQTVKSIDDWRLLLSGALPEQSARMTQAAVHNRAINLVSANNPANPHLALGMQNIIRPESVPADVTKRPRDRQLDYYQYQTAGLVATLADEPIAHLPVEGLREPPPARGGGRMGSPRDVRASPSVAMSSRDGTPAPMIDGAWTLAFPFPEDVYKLPIASLLRPEYIFSHTRPDVNRDTHQLSVGGRGARERTLAFQDAYEAGETSDAQCAMRELEDLRQDVRAADQSVQPERPPASRLEALSKWDKTLVFKLRNHQERIVLAERTRDMSPEERIDVMTRWKLRKIAEFMDYFKNCDPATSNSNLVAIATFYKDSLARKRTLVGETACRDPSLSVFANMMASLRAGSDKILKIYTSHPLWELILISALTAYRPVLGMNTNVMIPGDAYTGKSFLLRQLDHVLIPNTVTSVTRATLRAGQTEGDYSYEITVMDEAPMRMLDMDDNGKQMPSEPVLKSKTTSGAMCIVRCIQRPDGSHTTITTHIPCNGSVCVAFNEKTEQINAPLRSRFLMLAMPEDKRHDSDLSKNDIFFGQWTLDEDLEAAWLDHIRTIQMFVFLVENLIKIEVFDDVSMAVANHFIMKFTETLHNDNISANVRDCERLTNNIRELTIMSVVHTLFFSELGSEYKRKPWSDSFLLDVEKLLVATEEVSSYVIGLHSLAIVPHDSARILRTALAACDVEVPVQDAEGRITNAERVAFRFEGINPEHDIAYDYVVLNAASIKDVATRTRDRIEHPKPPSAAITEYFSRLKDQVINACNRNTNGSVLKPGEVRRRTQPPPPPPPSSDQDASILRSYTEWRAHCPQQGDAAADVQHSDAAVDQSRTRGPQQQMLQGFRAADQHGTHILKALIEEHTGVGSRNYVVCIATDIVVNPHSYKGLVEKAIRSALHAGTRRRRILTGLPHIEAADAPGQDGRKFHYLCAAMDIEPTKASIVLSKPFNTYDVGTLAYGAMTPTAYLTSAESQQVVVVVEGDWETLLFEERFKTLMPTDQFARLRPFVPSVAERLLPRIHGAPVFKSLCLFPEIKYPDDMVKKIKEREQLEAEIRKNTQTSMSDQRISRVRCSASFFDDVEAIDVADYMPTAYLSHGVVDRATTTAHVNRRRAAQVEQQIPPDQAPDRTKPTAPSSAAAAADRPATTTATRARKRHVRVSVADIRPAVRPDATTNLLTPSTDWFPRTTDPPSKRTRVAHSQTESRSGDAQQIADVDMDATTTPDH